MQEIKITEEGLLFCEKIIIKWTDIVNWRKSDEKIIFFEKGMLGRILYCPVENMGRREEFNKDVENYFIIYLTNGKIIRCENFKLKNLNNKILNKKDAEEELVRILEKKVSHRIKCLTRIDKMGAYSIILSILLIIFVDVFFFLLNIFGGIFIMYLVFFFIMLHSLFFFGDLGKSMRKICINRNKKEKN